jgi:signal transduction histidine kinase
MRVGLVVAAALASFVVGTYAVVVLGAGTLLGAGDSVVLPVVATAVVALGFEPVQRRAERAARALVAGPVSAYDVLSRFSETVTGGFPTAELPAKMAQLLAEGTGAAWAQVWLTARGRTSLAATWPPGATADTSPPQPGAGGVDSTADGRRAEVVRHGGHVYGVLRLQEQPGLPLSSVEERLFAGLAAQAGLVLRLVGLQTDLAARRDELATRAAELRASRDRLIATQDAERRRLERDMHDGAQQHLVALAVNLRLAESLAARSPERAVALLHSQASAAREAITTLTDLSRGIYPRPLETDGLVAALRAAVVRSPVPVRVSGSDVGRLPAGVEQALFFVALEALQNAGKHSGAAAVAVRVERDGAVCRLHVDDDGRGFSPDSTTAGGAGLANMRDRMDAVGGTVTVTSHPGQGTAVTASVPVPAIPEPRPGG